MTKKNILLFLLLSSIATLGGLIAYDVTVNHRLEKFSSGNWKWLDQWPNYKNPETPIEKEELPPPKYEFSIKEQIVVTSYKDAIEKAKEVKMPILILFEAEWCGWCKRMKQDTLSNEKVKAMMMNYIFLTIDTDKTTEVSKKFNVSSLPSYVITDSDGTKLKSDSGYKNPVDFEKWLDNISMFKNQERVQK